MTTKCNAASALDANFLLDDGPVMPVLTIHDPAHAVPLAHALLAGGIRLMEVTLRTPQALNCIAAIAQEVPEAIVGAGTVRNGAEVGAAQRAGARFLISPGYTRCIESAAREARLPWLPGVATSSEIMMALDAGHTALKFFPAVAAGGANLLKAWAGPFAEARFCPTGGIDPGNAQDFLALPNVACVGGSWIAPAALMQRGDWAAITRNAAEARALMPAR